MRTAIVILNWNGQKLLEQFLPTVISCSPNAEIYVADNASTDSSINYLTSCYPNIKLIRNTTNGGYSKGYNDALKHIEADIYCLLNSDIEVTSNWLSILKLFETDKNTVIAQPKILSYKDKTKFEYAGAGGGFIDKYGYPYCRGRLFDTLETDNGQYNDTTEIFWASGACLFIRSEVFHSLKGFDEDYFAHQEEIDLCWRAKNLGYSVKYVGTSTVYHVGGATLNEANPKKTYLNFRNNLLTLLKNLPTKSVFFIIFIRLILDGIAGVKFIFEGKFAHTFAIIKAHFSFYANVFKFISKRQNLNQLNNYYNLKSVVWYYFILNKKTLK